MANDANSRKSSEFANERQVSRSDAAALRSPAGRENDRGASDRGTLAADDLRQPVGARPRSSVTGRHDAGSGANETVDGLDSSTEELRHAAEDTPSGSDQRPGDGVPVFERGDLPPKI